ncbi:cytochrome P450 6A1-like [Neodiprion virginianus]|uniref:cytochrome P450 6A1-like n=1 Tax=Neodiprion virginianus TaxID=2961670 RepID=UPI001EE77B3F|nr:cytochrome P450 6A1-like [Neodiprion virginianus]
MIGALGPAESLCAVAIILTGIWYYLVANYSFWKERGILGPEPGLIFGNMKDVLLVRENFGVQLKKICDQFPGAPLIGVYDRRTPVLIVRDPELIKDVMIKDFSTFSERGLPVHDKVEPLSTHLFNLETTRWRPLRSKLSPAFTSGKMKNMFYLILECADYFEEYLNNIVEKGEPIDCREITAKYTTDVIGSCAFGLQMNALADEDSEFRKMGRKFFKMDRKRRVLGLLRSSSPWLYELLGISAMGDDITNFFLSSVKETIDHRMKNNVRRADLIEMLMEIKNHPEKSDFELTDAIIAAQAFVFFIAGFETSSTTISHALMELAQNHDLQERLRREIIESLEANNGDITYDGVKKLKYLDMVFQETLRLRPPVLLHMRKAMAEYTFRGTNLTIPKGQMIWIPTWEIQQNPEYYPKPTVFDPERFTDEMVKARHPMTYLPFGDGPRNCIGARFGTYQTKLGLIKILSNFKVDMSDKTNIPYVPNPAAFLLEPVGGVHLKFSKIK